MTSGTKPWKVRENRLRATAHRRGFNLHRSSRRDTQALDYGAYWLIHAATGNAPDAGVTLDDIELYLTPTEDDHDNLEQA